MTSYRTQDQGEKNTPHSSGGALELSTRITLTPEQLRVVRAIDDYDLWFVAERLKRDGASGEQIGLSVTEFKKYMVLFALGYEGLGMVSRDVDQVWHSFILFTGEYAKFCQEVFGRFIHHTPNTSRDPHLPRECVVNFADAYNHVFGPLPSIWDSEALRLTLSGDLSAAGDCNVGPAGQSVFGSPLHAGECNSAPRVPVVSDVAVGYSAAGDCGAVGGPN